MTTEYNVGLTEHELSLLVRLIDDEELTDDEEDELRGVRHKMVKKRKTLRQRGRNQEFT